MTDRSQASWDAADRHVERMLGHDCAAEFRHRRDIDSAKQALADVVDPPELDAATVAHLRSIGAAAAIVLEEIAGCNRGAA